ncbi:hypothetical protein LPN03_05420 [Arthrobacter sp. A2-55]|nr:hypothetical protein [Arthrobacter sp. A2-55]MCU6479796.1 hypothetical protein [Arthrobacter sp. A2-55]
MSNSFQEKDGGIDWSRFCSIIEESDVDAFGLTDYFNLDVFFTFRTEFESRYPNSHKAFFPVVELRLNEAVNKSRDDVNFHILFRPDETQDRINLFLGSLKTELTDEKDRRLTCLDLKTKRLLESASVTRQAIEQAYVAAFGKLTQTDHILTIVPSNNDGIRADNANQRKLGLADQIDKAADLIFGNASNSKWFLNKERFEAGAGPSRPKPVVTGSDAHNFDDLLAWLGRTVPAPNEKCITWIKADLTYEGLQQILVEPADRVSIGESKPDFKEPYRYIEKIVFDHPDFPSEIIFNPNLTSIIGSRSSGKSALLAYVAHAVNADHTLEQQQAVAAKSKVSDLGPAAGHTWASVEHVKRNIVWGNPEATRGQVIYVPQNSLFEISNRKTEITDKIRPALFRAYPELEKQFKRFQGEREAIRILMGTSISDWFSHTAAMRARAKDLAQLGDKSAIQAAEQSIKDEIGELRKASSLTDAENAIYTEVKTELAEAEEVVQQLDSELEGLRVFINISETLEVTASEQVSVSIETSPAVQELGHDLGVAIETLVQGANDQLKADLGSLIVEQYKKLTAKRRGLIERRAALAEEHEPLIARIGELAATSDLEDRLAAHQLTLSKIETQETLMASDQKSADKSVREITDSLATRDDLHKRLIRSFQQEIRVLDSMEFGLAIGNAPEQLDWLAQGFNKQAVSDYLSPDRQRVELDRIKSEPLKFIQSLESGTQKIRQGEESQALATRVLTAAPEVRLTATLDGDQVGGFETTTMTPGKQALFALTLILSESDEPWPLLLDQPEDDLDSRSIYEVIVPYLIARKGERQIIMVSHNANLVVGADSESIVIANRHGLDRKNRADRLFDYKSGSLEHSEPPRAKSFILESRGISEHACEILDGGTDAFEKRKNKYNIKWA